MDSLTLELFRRLQAGPYDESGFKHIQRLLGSQRRVLRSKQDLATLTEIAELLEAWAICAEDPQLGALVIAEAAEIAERELRRPALANELRALPAADSGEEQEQHPSGARAYAALGRSRVSAGHPSGAIEAYERALEIEAEPDFVKALADLYAQRGTAEDREQAADLYCTLGELLGPPDGAAMLKAALAQNPDHAEARALLGQYGNASGPESSAGAHSASERTRKAPPPLRATPRQAEPTPTPLTQRSTRPQQSVDRISSPGVDRISATPALAGRPSSPGVDRVSATPALAARPSSPGIDRISATPGRPSSPGVDRVSATPALGARPSSPGVDRISATPGRTTSPGVDRISATPALGARPSSPGVERISGTPALGARPSSAGGRSPIDRLSTPPGLGAPLQSAPTTQPYARQRMPLEAGAARSRSSLGTEASVERQSSTHAIPEPRPIGARDSASPDRQSSTHVIPESRPSFSDEAATDRQSSSDVDAATDPYTPSALPVSSQIPSALGAAMRREGRSAKPHSTLSGGWNPPAGGAAHIRAASNLRFGASGEVSSAADVSDAAQGSQTLKSTGTRARAQLAGADALADLLPGPEGSDPSILEIDISSAQFSDASVSSLSPTVRDEELEEVPAAAHKRNRLLGAGVALASACVVWLALVLAPRSTDPATGSRPTATSSGVPVNAPRSESVPMAHEDSTPKAKTDETTAKAATPANAEANTSARDTTAPDTQPTAASATPDTRATAAAAIPDSKSNPAPAKSDEGAAKDTRGAEAEMKPGQDRKNAGDDNATKPGPHVDATLELAGLRGGKINEAQLAAAIDKTTPKFDACYETALKTKPRLKGRLGFGWTIRPNGKVANVRKLNGAIKDPGLVKCTADAISAAHFPKPRSKAAEIFLSVDYRRP